MTTTTTFKYLRAERRALMPGSRPRARISTDELDSQRDRVFQSGLSFRENLRVLFGHDAHSLPVAEHLPADAIWFCGAVVVEHRYIGPIIGGAIGDGLRVR